MSAVPSTYYRIDPAKMKAARRAAFLTQQALSEVSGVSFNSIQRIEQGGKRTPLGQRVSTVKCLANALGISPVDILWTSSPPGQSPGRESVNHSGERAEKERQTPTPIEISGTQDLDLGSALAVEPKTPNAEGKDLRTQASVNGNGKHNPFAIDEHQQAILVRLWERRPGWAGELTYGGLVKLMKDHGAAAVNDALEDLIENADEVQRPYPYLAKVAAELGASHTQGVRG